MNHLLDFTKHAGQKPLMISFDVRPICNQMASNQMTIY